MARRVRETQAHFGIRVDGAGETMQVVDERGALVPREGLARWVADYFLSTERGGAFVVEESNPPSLDESLVARCAALVRIGGGRAAMAVAMRDREALVGLDANGGVWFANPPRPDALETLAVLLNVLSRSDAPLSMLVDDRLAASKAKD